MLETHTTHPPTHKRRLLQVGDAFLVYRADDKKVLKSVKYSPVNFRPLLGAFLVSTNTTTTAAEATAAETGAAAAAAVMVPVNRVARVLRLSVAGEDAAAELDSLIKARLSVCVPVCLCVCLSVCLLFQRSGGVEEDEGERLGGGARGGGG
jgi:hypothetical protein